MSDVAGGEGNRQDRDGETHSPPAFDRDTWLVELHALNPWAVRYLRQLDKLQQHSFLDEGEPRSVRVAKKGALQEELVRARRQASLDRWRQPGDQADHGRERWNAWAKGMLALRQRLRDGGQWKDRGPAQTGSPQARYNLLARTDFSELCFPGDFDFSQFVFPGAVTFERATFGNRASSPGTASFSAARFDGGPANFAAAHFDGGTANFDNAQFNGGKADFQGAEFSGGDAKFWVTFFRGGPADFSRASFSGGDAIFLITIFLGGGASFGDAKFSGGYAIFDYSQFREGNVDFADAEFTNGLTSFKGAQFSGGPVSFRGAEFVGEATTFLDAYFGGRSVDFSDTLIGSVDQATAQGVADFGRVRVDGAVSFNRSRISIPISFTASRFRGSSDFSACESLVGFSFADCVFYQVPDLIDAAFHQPPRLDNMQVRDPVSRYDRFDGDPRPHRSKWAQLFGVTRMALTRNANDEAKYRVLRKIAIDAQDHDRELEFHAQEIRCRRFWRDRPWGRWVYMVDEELPGKRPHTFEPRIRFVDKAEYNGFETGEDCHPDDPEKITLRRMDKRRRAAGAGRFWFGWAYGLISNFGRSMITPASIWAVLVVVFAFLFMVVREPPAGILADSASAERLFKCDVGPPGRGDSEAPTAPWINICQGLERSLRSTRDAGRSVFDALTGGLQENRCIAGRGVSPVQEAFALSFKNALVLIDWDRSEAARRTFGCLYGYDYDRLDVNEPSARGTSYPHVPFSVSVLSILQNLLSAILIFLFLLALRNLLKLK